jgi:hypothetical protein
VIGVLGQNVSTRLVKKEGKETQRRRKEEKEERKRLYLHDAGYMEMCHTNPVYFQYLESAPNVHITIWRIKYIAFS